jgi:hypothetical protein
MGRAEHSGWAGNGGFGPGGDSLPFLFLFQILNQLQTLILNFKVGHQLGCTTQNSLMKCKGFIGFFINICLTACFKYKPRTPILFIYFKEVIYLKVY